jgi:hypothetical protein
MRTVEQVIAWAVMLIVLFLILSRASEANSIINTLGGFASAETRNLQGYSPSGQLLSSPSTSQLGAVRGYTGPGATVQLAQSNPLSGLFGGLFG